MSPSVANGHSNGSLGNGTRTFEEMGQQQREYKVTRPAPTRPSTEKQSRPVSEKPSVANGPAEKSKDKPAGKTSKGKEVDPKVVAQLKKEEHIQMVKRQQQLPDFVGWKQVGGWEEREKLTSEEEAQDLLQRSTLLETYVTEKYYGDWYHNTALIVATSLFSWLVARLGGGLAWLAIVLAFAATAYRTSIRRLRRNVRDDITRELGQKKLETDTETLEWLNAFLIKFWLIYEPVLSETIVETTNQVLIGATPGFIESMTLTTFTLGTKPPRIDHVRTFPKSEEDVAVMDWKFSFTPNDTEDMTAKQLKNKVNPKIALGIRIGKGVVSKSLPILVEDTSFSGLMRVRIKMMTSFPHIQVVDVSFLEPPTFDFVLKPIGGETFGFDINVIPGLQSFITEMVHANLGPMFYAPNAFQLNIEQMLAGAGVDSAIGVLAVTVHYAKSLKGSEAIGNTVDPYIKFSFNERDELARSEIKDNTKNPTWNETKYLLVNNLNEVLSMEVVDFNDFRKDKSVGVVNFALEKLKEKPDQDALELPVLAAGKHRGTLCFDVHWYPCLEGKTLDDGTLQPPPPSNTGIVKFTVHQCKDLDATKSMVGQLSPYADLMLNDRLLMQTKSLKRTNNPVWDENYEFLVTNKSRCKLGVRVKDSRGLASDPVLGTYKLSLDKFLESIAAGQDWFQLTPAGRVRMSATWKPVGLKDVGGAGAAIEPIGVLRFHFKNAVELAKLDSLSKIDPYLRVFVGGFQRGRTDYFRDEQNPNWDQIVYVPVFSNKQKVSVEAMDWEKVGKDRTLGSFDFNTGDLVKQNEKTGEYLASDVFERTGQFRMDRKAPKGTLKYTVQFYPNLPIMDPEEAEEKRKEAEKAKEEREAAIARGEDPDKEAKQAEEQAKKDQEKREKEAKKADEADLASDEEYEYEDEVPEENPEDVVKDIEPEKIELPLEEQIKYGSGIFAFSITKVVGAEPDVFLRTVIDKNEFPFWISPKLKGGQTKIMENSEAMVRELEWSEISFQIVPKENTLKDSDIIAQVNIPTLKLLQDSYNSARTLNLTAKGGRQVKVTVKSRYFPIKMELDPRESVNNSGTVRIDVLDATDLPAADRSGKSDPYAIFEHNGVKVFKTKTIKKTLTPVWNEYFEMDIPDRVKDKLQITVNDWDMGPAQDDLLGHALLPLEELEPMQQQVLILPLEGDAGSIRVKVNFRPGYVAKKWKTSDFTATFSGAVGAPGKMLTDVGGGAVKVVGGGASMVGGVAGGVAGGVTGGMQKGGNFITSHLPGRRHKKDKDTASIAESNADYNPAVDTSNQSIRSGIGSIRHKRHASISSQPNSSTGAGSEESGANPGPGQVTLLMTRGFEGINHLQVRVYLVTKKEKEIYKTKPLKSSGGEATIQENVSFKAPAHAELVFRVRDHKSIGSDKELGEGRLVVGEAAGEQHSIGFDGLGELLVYVNYASPTAQAAQ